MDYIAILGVLLLCIIVIKLRYRVQIYKSTRHAITSTLLFLVVGVAWDSFSIYRGIWTFPGTGTLGILIGLMPLEEYLFILILPLWILTLYRVLAPKKL